MSLLERLMRKPKPKELKPADKQDQLRNLVAGEIERQGIDPKSKPGQKLISQKMFEVNHSWLKD